MESGQLANPKAAVAGDGGDEGQHWSYATQLAISSVLPMVLNAAVQLDVFEIIAKAGPGAQLSASEIASHIPTTKNPAAPAMLDRMLHLLASNSILVCSVVVDGAGDCQRLYGLAPVAKYFVRDEDGASLGPLMHICHHKAFIDSWYELKNAVLEGGVPFARANGVHCFEYAGKDPKFNEDFNKACRDHTTIVMKKILECYKGFEHIGKLVDVAGGLGINLGMITSKYPKMEGINFDLPHVLQNAPSYPGVKHVAGDMFVSVPEGDAIFMKWIIHDWSDEHIVKLLKNCYKALPEKGKVIAVDAVRPEKPETSSSAAVIGLWDLITLMLYQGGRERSEKEFLALAKAAGFRGIDFQCFVADFWVMEFYK